MTDRYHVGEEQGEAEPGSNGQVLANKLGLTDQASLDEAEAELLLKLYEDIFATLSIRQRLSSRWLKQCHYRWLGAIYPWAGEERQVNLAKDDFMFAAAAQIPGLLQQLDERWLSTLTPCCSLTPEQATQAIAEVHVELILIHPFREGNGRIARLLADAMAYQAGLGLLDYTSWQGDKSGYIAAIHAGMGRDYSPMATYIRRAIVS
ncbi:Fic family protein [Salinicola sp. JS01]|uniref:Fic/DOC family protein n=1 Tax=Salinicola sp. JS01 TaxID=3050071 RepID=UPI00255BF4DA|nr:Fic family protein [Salinicola sp. JS01]WIX34067.1 Fic family protein [Salinicola sp. JS01]